MKTAEYFNFTPLIYKEITLTSSLHITLIFRHVTVTLAGLDFIDLIDLKTSLHSILSVQRQSIKL